VFKVCRAFETEWITYRRGKLKTTLIKPTAYPHPPAEAEAEAEAEAGERGVVQLSDELVEFKDYGVCRQLTLFEDGAVQLQVLTSDMSADAVSLLSWLRSRWRIENAIKDLSRLYGIDWLCDYRTEEIDDTTEVDNPARAFARHTLADREKDLSQAERALARLIESPERPIAKVNKKIPAARRAVDKATRQRDAAKQALNGIPAKIPVNELKPGQQRSLPAIGRRTFQMVLRMLAYNSELFLADRLNAYLRDDNEYRTLTRSLFQLHGDLDYRPGAITVTLDPPDSPRLTRALALLIDEINQTPPRLPGDPRPITYKIKSKQ
jgi:hypothetical protein